MNNKVVAVTKPNGSVTTNAYDNAQRITSTIEKTSGGTVITGFTYTYDALGRIAEEGNLVQNTKICYTYDDVLRVTKSKTVILSNNGTRETGFNYDAAGNIITDYRSYDTNNRLTTYSQEAVSYDEDGNMLTAIFFDSAHQCIYDSANRLLKAGSNIYTYNAEDVRIRNQCGSDETIYTYNTQCRLSQLLMKTTNGVVTKYVYGLGLIGEEEQGCFKTYHFDYRGSTVAITNESGCVTDTFAYDTYGMSSRSGNSDIIFGYNGRDGSVTDYNGLVYMRARYYSPELGRFVNADIIKGEITNAITLNRYAYANGNPVSNVDPFGLAVERGETHEPSAVITAEWEKFLNEYFVGKNTAEIIIDDEMLEALYQYMRNAVLKAERPSNIGKGVWAKQVQNDLQWVDDVFGSSSKLAKGIDVAGKIGIVFDVGLGIYENIQTGVDAQRITTDAVIDAGVSVGSGLLSTAAGSAATGFVAGSVAPGIGNLIGVGVGFIVGIGIYVATDVVEINGKATIDWVKDGLDWLVDGIVDWFD